MEMQQIRIEDHLAEKAVGTLPWDFIDTELSRISRQRSRKVMTSDAGLPL